MSKAKLKARVLDRGISAGDPWLTVPREAVRDALAELKAQGFRSFLFMTCVDHLATPLVEPPPERFELVYQLRRMDDGEEVRVRAFVPESDPRAASVHDLFKPADWDEREVYDLFGIQFDGHPRLTRILMPDDWSGHPLRRDYPVGGEPVEFSDDHEAWQTSPEEA